MNILVKNTPKCLVPSSVLYDRSSPWLVSTRCNLLFAISSPALLLSFAIDMRKCKKTRLIWSVVLQTADQNPSMHENGCVFVSSCWICSRLTRRVSVVLPTTLSVSLPRQSALKMFLQPCSTICESKNVNLVSARLSLSVSSPKPALRSPSSPR